MRSSARIRFCMWCTSFHPRRRRSHPHAVRAVASAFTAGVRLVIVGCHRVTRARLAYSALLTGSGPISPNPPRRRGIGLLFPLYGGPSARLLPELGARATPAYR